MKRRCANPSCGKLLEHQRKDAAYCSSACRAAMSRLRAQMDRVEALRSAESAQATTGGLLQGESPNHAIESREGVRDTAGGAW